jgi:hypothetical protein
MAMKIDSVAWTPWIAGSSPAMTMEGALPAVLEFHTVIRASA